MFPHFTHHCWSSCNVSKILKYKSLKASNPQGELKYVFMVERTEHKNVIIFLFSLSCVTFVACSYKVSLEETPLSTLCTEPWLGRSVKIEKSFSQNASLQITKSFPLRVSLGFYKGLGGNFASAVGLAQGNGAWNSPRAQMFKNEPEGNYLKWWTPCLTRICRISVMVHYIWWVWWEDGIKWCIMG